MDARARTDDLLAHTTKRHTKIDLL
jgi:hypothetical protein